MRVQGLEEGVGTVAAAGLVAWGLEHIHIDIYIYNPQHKERKTMRFGIDNANACLGSLF